ncbi:MAG: hypothetical protein Q4A03_03705 [Rothia sp. (in: high G+C Gram-positive bacteria)]|uniref:hypothetical protein n=1 Tax=Rothia sp. (in: high G+C Gram-positive bacteria) TaxID=1885016 RepID=UPI00270DCCF7|nr:hypothetical protein [Rothia sp. (in: high G+C Gram-positive bacteria)]
MLTLYSRKHTWALTALGALVTLSLIFAFIASTRYAPTGPTPQEQAQAHIDIWGEAEVRPVNNALSYSGTAHSGATVPLTITPPADAVLVYSIKHPGDQVAPGDLIGIVGGEGIYALEGPLPLYRSLTLGDTGHDVQELQRAIAAVGYRTNTDGTVTDTTLAAVSALLRSELTGIPAEGIDTINPTNFAVLPAGPRIVATAASVGSTISSENPLLTLHTSSAYADFKAPLRDIDTLTTLETLTITSSAGTTQARIDTVGDLETGQDGAYRTIRLLPDDPSILIPEQTLSITTAGDESPVLAVPISAVRQDGSSTYVITQAEGGSQERLTVTLLRTGEGYAAIDGALTEGQKVLLS